MAESSCVLNLPGMSLLLFGAFGNRTFEREIRMGESKGPGCSESILISSFASFKGGYL